jgi:hypothetical protein
MSSWKFKSLQKAHDVVILYFTETDNPLWANTRSVTIAVGDAEKLLKKLQATLHPGGKPSDP